MTNPINAHLQAAGVADRRARPRAGARLLRRRAAADRRASESSLPPCRSPTTRSSSRSASSGLTGEEGFTTLERRWARPTFDVHGIWGGQQVSQDGDSGPGRRKVQLSPGAQSGPAEDRRRHARIPARPLPAGHRAGDRSRRTARPASSCRSTAPMSPPLSGRSSRALASRPSSSAKGARSRSSTTFREQLGVDTLLLGWGLDDDNTHSPNEKFCLADFHRGIKASAHLWNELSGAGF